MDSQQSTLTIREYPFGLWIAGIFLVSAGIDLYLSTAGQVVIPGLIFLAGLAFLSTATTLTVTADRPGQMLTLRYRALLWGSRKEVPLAEIAAIQVEMSRSGTSNGATYRVAVVRKDGEKIPFRSYFSSGAGSKQKKAEQLRNFLGVQGNDETPSGLFGLGKQVAQQVFQGTQESLTGPEMEEHTTDGIHWKVQTRTFGGKGITRWFSPDFKCSGGFLFLTQKVAGQKTMAGGLMGGVGKMLYQQTIGLYGFGSEDTPGLETAEILEPLEANLEPHFSAFTSDPAAARQLLTPWVAAPLADWAGRYPLKQVQPQGIFGQLVVLFSPVGTYVASMGIMIPEAVEELTNLGVALVKTQGSSG